MPKAHYKLKVGDTYVKISGTIRDIHLVNRISWLWTTYCWIVDSAQFEVVMAS